MDNKKIVSYLLYALGEIILVVIGIMIAVNINNWNQQVQDREKEKEYLTEIRENLQEDIQLAEYIIQFDSVKSKSIQTVFEIFGSGKSEEEMAAKAVPYFNILFEFSLLGQSSVAFDNMISAESIGLISNRDLRSKLSIYYSNDFISEERTKELTRSFSDLVVPLVMNPAVFNQAFGTDLQIEAPSGEIVFYKNPYVLAGLANMLKNMEFQILSAEKLKKDAQELIAAIDEELSKE